MPKIKLSRQIMLDGKLRKPSEGEIEVSQAAYDRAKGADAIATSGKPEVKPQGPSQIPAQTGA